MNFKSVLAVVAVLSLMTGCAMSEQQPKVSPTQLADAKHLTQRSEVQLVDLLPEEDVSGVEQLSEGTVLRCGDGFQWSGRIRATLSDGVNADTAQEQIAEAATSRGDVVSEDRVSTGGRRYSIRTKDEVVLLVTVWDNGTMVNITSASPCFRLPDNSKRPRS
ncbi:hypothetical protein [Curtobacterium sp. 9128]|uniref:hypothetical protein n=1 Tax=Curtobacterium sp. 9128 TaxID=1793722 RepID=UPI0011A58ECB|nr:hypothetical protein [Curtobacterium sp. 9128]